MMSCIMHMKTYICHLDVLHRRCDVFDRESLMSYRVDEMEVLMGFKSDIEDR